MAETFGYDLVLNVKKAEDAASRLVANMEKKLKRLEKGMTNAMTPKSGGNSGIARTLDQDEKRFRKYLDRIRQTAVQAGAGYEKSISKAITKVRSLLSKGQDSEASGVIRALREEIKAAKKAIRDAERAANAPHKFVGPTIGQRELEDRQFVGPRINPRDLKNRQKTTEANSRAEQKAIEEVERSTQKYLENTDRKRQMIQDAELRRIRKLRDMRDQVQRQGEKAISSSGLDKDTRKQLGTELHRQLQQLEKDTAGVTEREAKNAAHAVSLSFSEQVKAAKDYAKDVKKEQDESDKNSERNTKREESRQRQVANAIERARTKMLNQVNNASELSEEQRKALADDAAERLKMLETETANHKVHEAQRAVDGVKAAFAEEVAAARNAQRQSVGGSGRRLNTFFNVQQAFEDFDAAGFRGISNNLALILTQLGNVRLAYAGLGALIAGVVGKWAYDMYRAADATKALGDATEVYNRKLKERLELEGRLIGDVSGGDQSISSQTNAVREARAREESALRAQRENSQRLINLYKQRAASERQQQINDFAPGLSGTDDSYSRILREIRALEERSKTLKEEVNTRSASRREEERLLETAKKRQNSQERFNKLLSDGQSVQRSATDVASVLEKKEEKILRLHQEQVDAIGQAAKANRDRVSSALAVQEFLREGATKEERKKIQEEINRLLKQDQQINEDLEASLTQQTDETRKLLDENDRRKRIHDDMLSQSQSLESSLMSQVESTKQAAKAELERATAIRDSARMNQVGFQQNLFGAKGGLVDLVAQKQIDKIQMQADKLKKFADFEYQFFKPAADIAKNNIENAAKAMIDAIERRARQAKFNLKKQEASFLNRQAEGLATEADAAKAQGKFEIADKKAQQSIDLLQRLQQMLLSDGGEFGPKVVGANLKAAEQIQARINAQEEQRAKFAQAAAAAEEGKLKTLQEQLMTVTQVKAQAQNTTFIGEADFSALNKYMAKLSAAAAIKGALAGEGGAKPIGSDGIGGFGATMDAKASGGPLRVGVPTLVGEQGPELILPQTRGNVITAQDTQKLLNQYFSMPMRGGSPTQGGGMGGGGLSIGTVNVGAPSGVSTRQVFRDLGQRAKFQQIRQG